MKIGIDNLIVHYGVTNIFKLCHHYLLSVAIVVDNLSFQYGTDPLFDEISFEIKKKSWVGLTGRSGSGKTTLLFLLSTLLKPQKGMIHVFGSEITKMKRKQVNKFRLKNIGFVFQDNNLIPDMTAFENIELPLVLAGIPKSIREKQVIQLMSELEISDCSSRLPHKLSGGQQQRVALARALVNHPQILFADEPTGSLDSISEENLLDILKTLNREGLTIVCATHSPKVLSYCNDEIIIEKLVKDT